MFAMQLAPLTFKSIRARAVVLKLKRPVVARIATITDWPLILIDLFTEEGIVGRSYLEPYTIKAMRYLVPALQDFGAMLDRCDALPLEHSAEILQGWDQISLHHQGDEISGPSPARFRRYARGAARRTGRTLRSRTQVAALCRLSRTFYDRGVRTGYGGLGCPGKG